MSKIDVSNMDLYYGDFHALKNINLSIDANEVKIHQQNERSRSGLPDHR